jgi:hypothetical protein
MADLYPASVQRLRLLEFATAIAAAKSCLRRDECGDWACFGRTRHVFAVPEGFQFYVSTGGRPKKWTSIKRRLPFCRVSQDGDDEGCFFLDRLPSAEEGELIRGALGISKARVMTEELLTQLAEARVKSPLFGAAAPKSRVHTK